MAKAEAEMMRSGEDVDEVLAALRRDGYAVVRSVVPKAELSELARHLADEYRRAVDSGAMFEGGGSLSGHLNCFPGERARFVFEAVEESGVLEVVRRYDQPEADRVRATMNFNLPGSVVQHFHTDGLYTEAFLICNIAVVDTTLDNGAIELIPGSHQRFYKFWQYATEHIYRKSERIPMQRGDVLLRISTVWHRGMPNHSNEPRPMMSLTFGEQGAPDSDPFEVNGGNTTFTPNWYGTDRLSQLREKAFIRVPYLYSSMRFARSLVGSKGYSSW